MRINCKSTRIKLRKLKISDAEFLCKNANDKDIVRYTYVFPPPFNIKKAKEFIRKIQKEWKDKKSFEFGIELKKSRKLIGTVNIFNINYRNKKAEVGLWLSKKYWGRGLAEESLSLLLCSGFNKLKLKKFQARILHKNIFAQKLIEKMGFKLEKRLKRNTFFKNEWFDDLIYIIKVD
ncbi:MAG: GNAT family protein [Candidatus Nealsonbacteria bacterium]